ncbi:MAG: hypothetical protein ACREBE_10450, partial [bacterium]
SHTQYFIASAAGGGMVASLFVEAIAIGYVRQSTGSLIPGIIAHALGNLPVRSWGVPVILLLMAALIVHQRQAVSTYAIRLWRDMMVRSSLMALAGALPVIALLFAVVKMAPTLFPVLSALLLGVALLLESRERSDVVAECDALLVDEHRHRIH